MFTPRSFMVSDVIIKFLINRVEFCICYNVEMGNLVLFLILEKKTFNFASLYVMLTVGFSYMACIILRYNSPKSYLFIFKMKVY